MANPHRGEVGFEAGGVSYVLRFSINAICELENLLNRGFLDITDEMATWSPPAGADGKPKSETVLETVDRLRRIRAGTVRAVFWASLRDSRKDITVDQVGDLIETPEIGGMMGALLLISRSLAAAQPPARPTPPAQKKRDRRGGRGTGPA